ncbi:Copia protein, partial [Anthophora quadrimaculata]
MALAAQYDLNVHQLDVTTAYLNAVLKETVFMEVPKFTEEVLEEIIRMEQKSSEIGRKASEMLNELRGTDKVCLLKKALYGLRQAGRSWHEKLSDELQKFGLTRSSADPCVFRIEWGADILIEAIYVDDIIVASRNRVEIDNLKHYLSRIFDIRDLEEIKHCLGMEFSRSRGGITVNQKGYINDLLRRFGMSDSKAVATPLEVGSKLMTSVKRTDGANRNSLTESWYNNCYDASHWSAAKRVRLLEIWYAASSEMAADVLTKGLPGPKHQTCVNLLGMVRAEI